MKKTLLLTTCLTGVLLLSACSTASSMPGTPDNSGQPQNAPQANGGNGGQGFGQRGPRPMTPEEMQADIDEANAATDKTTLTKDQFTAELQTLMAAQRAKFRQQSSGQQSSYQGSRGFMTGQSRSGMPDRLATAVTFYKYTDPNGNEALLALDANGSVVMKWPRAFGRGGSGGPGGQGGMGGQPQAASSSDAGAQQ